MKDLSNKEVPDALRKGSYTGKGLLSGYVTIDVLKSDGFKSNEAALLLELVATCNH